MHIVPNPATFGIIAPAFQADPQKLAAGIRNLQKKGHNIITGNSIEKKHFYFSGSDRERADDINNMFVNPDVDAILCTRGGWGSLRLLDKLDYELISRHPKLLIGYSDITSLQLAIWNKCAIPSLSGPLVAVDFAGSLSGFTACHFWKQIYNSQTLYRYEFDQPDIEIWNHGQAEGLLLGGCLSMIIHQLGTPYSPDYRDAILFIEDIGDEPYKIDRNLSQLEQSGILKDLKGLIIGQFIDCRDNHQSRNHISIRMVLQEFFQNRPYPVIYNFPYGHSAIMFSLPIGITAQINSERKTLTLANLFS